MPQYSSSGYISAVQLRTRKTILTEGRDDKRFIARVLLEHGIANNIDPDTVAVDISEIISSIVPGEGKRDVVERTHAEAIANGIDLAAVVDREFREFDFNGPIADKLRCHNIINQTCFWTYGHSIENYGFTSAAITDFIRFQYPESIPHAFIADFTGKFRDIAQWSAALSISLFKAHLLKRSLGLVSDEHWLIVGAMMSFDITAYVNDLTSRGVNIATAAQLESDTRNAFAEILALGDQEFPRWITHGHIGTEMIWTGAAAVARRFCTDSHIIEGIATGYPDLKTRHIFDGLARSAIARDISILPSLWIWLGLP